MTEVVHSELKGINSVQQVRYFIFNSRHETSECCIEGEMTRFYSVKDMLLPVISISFFIFVIRKFLVLTSRNVTSLTHHRTNLRRGKRYRTYDEAGGTCDTKLD